MKAIVIENEFHVAAEVLDFLEKNPNLFEGVDKQIACAHRPIEDVGRFIANADAIVFQSQFISSHRHQLESFLDAFVNGVFRKKNYKFYIYDPIDDFNNWINNSNYFEDHKKFITNLKKLVKTRDVFSFNNKAEIKKINYNKSEFTF